MLLDVQDKSKDSSDNPLDDYEMSRVMARQTRSTNKTNVNEVNRLFSRNLRCVNSD
jgi:hypothetical protein